MIEFIAGGIFGFVLACIFAAKRVRLAEATLLQLRRQRQDYP
jgi:hypothetical protein